MEIKDTLIKPYNEEERMSFIVRNNHQQGFEIRETANALEAWGKTDEEQAEETKQSKISALAQQLDKLDLKTIRALRAIQAGQGTQDDTEKLAELEALAEDLRQQINVLQE